MAERRILRLTGSDREDFLQGLVTNDVAKLSHGLVYAALLTPQGKFIADFFLKQDGDGILLDVADSHADGLVQRLTMYKLRSDVTIEPTGLHLYRGVSDCPADGLADPRHPDLGWRAYRSEPSQDDPADWTALRVALAIPEAGTELTQDSYILEMGFERLNGVDFKKGCYVGQEVTARMKHKTTLRKGLARVALSGPVESGTEITSNGKAVGQILSQSDKSALAYLRFDRAGSSMKAGDVEVSLSE